MDISTQTDQSGFCARGDAQPGRATRCRLRGWQAGVRTHLLWPLLPSPAPAAAAPQPLLLLLLLQFAVPSLMLLTDFGREWLRPRPRPVAIICPTQRRPPPAVYRPSFLFSPYTYAFVVHTTQHTLRKKKHLQKTNTQPPRLIPVQSRRASPPHPSPVSARERGYPRAPAEPRPFLPCPSLSPSPSLFRRVLAWLA
ncbi:hypothetical protein IWZ01DRAFT_209245 [Phyllosticta capitalensis]|uniref:Uncharacterized protein n=1 Tax=Phyllosticta capitalensis TaxID=121624 RepID=A0ABR1YVN2_9PEZI